MSPRDLCNYEKLFAMATNSGKYFSAKFEVPEEFRRSSGGLDSYSSLTHLSFKEMSEEEESRLPEGKLIGMA